MRRIAFYPGRFYITGLCFCVWRSYEVHAALNAVEWHSKKSGDVAQGSLTIIPR